MTSFTRSPIRPDLKTSRPPVAQRPPAADSLVKIRRLWIACLALAAAAAVSALDYPPLTPNPEAFKARREKFMSKLPPKSVVILVGSSRVDLQACKLEYSIVSPK